ncbi:MAG: hypothetical protein IH914_08720 [candidate division Zixibacteria bacterium]|nr:hypothetical protein [candidate division Zixibacteria bacterium]
MSSKTRLLTIEKFRWPFSWPLLEIPVELLREGKPLTAAGGPFAAAVVEVNLAAFLIAFVCLLNLPPMSAVNHNTRT